MPVWDQPRSFWTWGNVSDEPSEQERQQAAAAISQRMGREVSPPPIPNLSDVTLRASRVSVPDTLSGRCTPMAGTYWNFSKLCAASLTTHRTLSPIRATRTSWRRY